MPIIENHKQEETELTFILHCSAVSSAEKNGIAEKKRFNRKPTKSLDVVVEGS